MRKISEVQQFDRVVYAVGGVEYDAIALGTPATRRARRFQNGSQTT